MSTIDKKEVNKFSKLANEWWNPKGKFKPLHVFNPIRIEFIKQKLISYYGINQKKQYPLKKLNILDIGCGGGLLCEPLKRLGANVTGIDASRSNIEVSKLHAKEMNLNINYVHCSPENFKFKNKFDIILNMEVVEHVSDVDFFIKNCSTMIKNKGIMFVATINKNLKSYFFSILGAEYILRWLPIGTHDWNKFLSPQELDIIAKKNKFINEDIVGIKYNIFSQKWEKSLDLSVNYISTFQKS